jgi:hypothetical protein
MSYILFFIAYLSTGMTVNSAEFSDVRACEEARKQLLSIAATTSPAQVNVAICQPKASRLALHAK